MELLVQQRNQLFALLEASGLPMHVFTPVQEANKYQITGSDTYWFKIESYLNRSNEDAYNTSMRPGVAENEMVSTYKGDDWDNVLKDFKKWVAAVQRELDTPDLWAEAARNAQLFGGTAEAPDEKFTRAELAQVQAQLRQLEQSFAAAALPEAARQKLIALTQAASVKAEGLTKKDWQNWIIGGLISAISGLLLNPTQAQEVLKLVKAAFGGLFLH